MVLAARAQTQVYTFSTLAGANARAESVDGKGGIARFLSPIGMAADGAGNIYIVDTGNSTIRKIVPVPGIVTTIAGTPGQTGYRDGPGGSALFNQPRGVAADSKGNLYVTDEGNHTIRKITPGGVVSTIAGSPSQAGYTDGPAANAGFSFITGIAVSTTGDLYVSDSDNNCIRKITSAGMVTTFAGRILETGSADGRSTLLVSMGSTGLSSTV